MLLNSSFGNVFFYMYIIFNMLCLDLILSSIHVRPNMIFFTMTHVSQSGHSILIVLEMVFAKTCWSKHALCHCLEMHSWCTTDLLSQEAIMSHLV